MSATHHVIYTLWHSIRLSRLSSLDNSIVSSPKRDVDPTDVLIHRKHLNPVLVFGDSVVGFPRRACEPFPTNLAEEWSFPGTANVCYDSSIPDRKVWYSLRVVVKG